IGANGESLKNITAVRQALSDFQTAETALQTLKAQNIDTINVYNSYKEAWSTNMAKLKDAQSRATAAWALATGGKPESETTLSKLYAAELARISDQGKKNLETLLAATP